MTSLKIVVEASESKETETVKAHEKILDSTENNEVNNFFGMKYD